MTQTALYRHFDEAGRLLYVGISLSAVQRLSQHSSKPWASEIRTVTVEMFPGRAKALIGEADAIRTEGPLFNVTGRRGRSHKGRSPLEKFLAVTGETQSEFARRLNVGQATISRLARMSLRPGLALAVAIERETKGEVTVASWASRPGAAA